MNKITNWLNVNKLSKNTAKTNSGRLMLGSCFALPTLDLICPRELRAIKHLFEFINKI